MIGEPSTPFEATPRASNRVANIESLRQCFPDLVLEFHTEIDSTNDRARSVLRLGAGQCLIVAEQQTAGRGRHGRPWVAPPGAGLLFSLGLAGISGEAGGFQLAAAAAICQALEQLSPLRPTIKWPNDVMVNGRKLAGILAETVEIQGNLMQGEPAPGDRVIIGVGLNVGSSAADYPEAARERGITLSEAAPGIEWKKQELLALIAAPLLRLARSRMRNAGDDSLWRETMDGWRRRCDTLGRWVELRGEGIERIQGTALDIEPDGSLVVRLANGGLRSVRGGEVTVAGSN